MGVVLWTVREGRVGEFDGPEIMRGYRSSSAVEPKLGDHVYLPDRSGPWRIVDWIMGERIDSPENVLIVELFGD